MALLIMTPPPCHRHSNSKRAGFSLFIIAGVFLLFMFVSSATSSHLPEEDSDDDDIIEHHANYYVHDDVRYNNITIDNRRHATTTTSRTTTTTRNLTNMTKKELRIINGVSAPQLRYPYTASLQLNKQHYCGGALVAPDIVVTAAHCAETSPIITLGRYDLDDPLDSDYEEMTVTRAIIHPQFDKVVVDNDVALLLLEKQSIHPYIRINNSPNIPIDGEELTVMGWGDIDDHPTVKEVSDELREAQVWYLINSKCEESKGIINTSNGFQEASYKGELTDNMMCAKDHIGTVSDACQGDSGGALVRTGTHPTGEDDVLLGLVSWGYGCADPNFPGVYSRLSEMFEPWLRPTICRQSNAPPTYLSCNTLSVPIATAPSSAPPPPSAGTLTFLIKTDQTPEDTGWELRTVSDNKIIASRPMGYYTKQQQEIIEKEVVEPENFYKLIIYDRDQDGFQGIMAVYDGESTARSNLLLFEPGFSSKSKGSVTHGFYVGSNPPNVLTLDIKFDSNPNQLALILTNKEDNLQLFFRWFDFYTEAFVSVQETIPIYGSERGMQEYQLTVYDSAGDGLCCSSGFGSYSLYLGPSMNANNLITSGSQYLTDEFYTFKVGGSDLVSSPNPPPSPSNLFSNPAPNSVSSIQPWDMTDPANTNTASTGSFGGGGSSSESSITTSGWDNNNMDSSSCNCNSIVGTGTGIMLLMAMIVI